MDRQFARMSAALLVIAATGAACAPVRTHTGYRADYNNLEIPTPLVGVDTTDTVAQRFGTPSTTAVFDQTTWYYVSANQQRIAFYSPRVTDRRIMVVKFDADNKVATVENYGIERGQVVAYNDAVTPTRGRELGVLEQIFGNIGSTPPIRTEEDQQGGGRRGRDRDR
jgi:outer membrane protein assembly factor BamE (lipoprotein component of BamABCDE complex)